MTSIGRYCLVAAALSGLIAGWLVLAGACMSVKKSA
jgi:hypothetical protein